MDEIENNKHYYCSFCCKNVDGRLPFLDENEGVKILQFVHLIQNYLRQDFIEKAVIKVLKSCQNCLMSISSFCKLFYELKCLEIKVEGKLGLIKSLVERAKLDESLNSPELEKVAAFRNEFVQKCNQYFSKSLPRVSLKRVCPSLLSSARNRPIPSRLEESERKGQIIFGDSVSQVKNETLEEPPFGTSTVGSSESNSNNDDHFEPAFSIGFGSSSSCISDPKFQTNFVCVTCSSTFFSQVKLETHNRSFCPPGQIPRLKPYFQKEESINKKTKTGVRSSGRRAKKSITRLRSVKRRTKSKRSYKYNCVYCNHKVGNYKELRSHRRNTRHTLMKKRFLALKLKAKSLASRSTKAKVNKLHQRTLQLQSSRDSAAQIKVKVVKIANQVIGVLRPRKSKPNQSIVNDRSYSENDDDELFNGGSDSGTTSSSATSSLFEEDEVEKASKKKNNAKVKKERKELICEGCGAVFKYRKVLLEHKVKAHGAPAQRKFSCSCCDAEFLSWPALMQHNASLKHKILEAKHKESGQTEKIAQVQINAPPTLIDETSDSSSSSETYSTSSDDDEQDVSEPKLKCSHCNKIFANKLSFTKHEAKCERKLGIKKRGPYLIKSFKCIVDACHEKFHTKAELKVHKRLHGQFPCSFCDVIETYAVDLSLHEMTHAQKNSLDNFTCARCPYSCNAKFFYLDHHLERHLGLSRKTAQCPVCKALFKDALKLERHVKLNHPKNEKGSGIIQKYKCVTCSAVFKKDFQLVKHQRKMHPSPQDENEEEAGEGEKFMCNICGKEFPNKKLLNAHHKFEHGLSFICEVNSCSARFSTKEELERHAKHHGTFPCTLCSTVETFAIDLALHEASHLSAEEKYNCARCTFSTVLKANYLNHHLDSHLGLEWATLTCPICTKKIGASSPNDAMLYQRLHMKNHHNTEGMSPDLISKCDQCPAYFRKYTQLFQHKKTIHNVKHPLICADCGTHCPSGFLLKKHRIKKHEKKEADFKFRCNSLPNCEESFEEKFQLDWHQRKEHDEQKNEAKKKFICAECGKVWNTLNGLGIHERKHRNERNGKNLLGQEKGRFVCEECGKGCKCKFSLQLHRLSHTGPQSWQHECLFCGKKCMTEEKLSEHLRTHTRERPYICEECGEEYAHGHNLKNHRNKAHGANDLK